MASIYIADTTGIPEYIDNYTLNEAEHYYTKNSLNPEASSLCIKLIKWALNNNNLLVCHDDNGKPYIYNCDIQISFSHRDNIVMVGIGKDSIGVDIELVENDILSDSEIRPILSDEEKKLLSNKTDCGEANWFSYIISRKECYLKNSGFKPLNKIDTTSINGIQTFQIKVQNNNYYLSIISNEKQYFIWEVCIMFEIIKGDTNIPEGKAFIERKAIKGLVKVNGKYLVLKTNKGDYKIPGGGQKKNEDALATLKREFDEEVGFKLTNMGTMLGITKEVGPDKFDPDAYFAMTNMYYACEVDTSKSSEQGLDSYEAELEIKPVWVDLKDIVANNERLLKSKPNEVNPWVERELGVFNKLIEMEIEA